METNKTAQERFFQSCEIGDLNKIKTDLFYNVSPFCQDKVTSLSLFIYRFISQIINILTKYIIKLLMLTNISFFDYILNIIISQYFYRIHLYYSIVDDAKVN